MFAAGGSGLDDSPTFGPPAWFERAGAECLAVQHGAGVLDRTATAKFEVSGAGAADFLDGLSASTLPANVGDIAQALMLNASGGIECSFEVTRLAHDRFYLSAPAAAEVHHLDWLRRHRPSGGDLSIDNVTERDGILLIVGPPARGTYWPGLPVAAWPGRSCDRTRRTISLWSPRRCAHTSSMLSANAAGSFTTISTIRRPSTTH